MRRALVTGAYGLLGTALVRRLLQEGVEVAVLRRDPSPRSALVLEGLEDQVAVVPGDVTDAGSVHRALAEHGADTVFHLAAQSIAGVAQRSPLPTWETNVRGTWTVVEACRQHGVARTVVTTSHKAYGAHDRLPLREDFALRARAPYDVSKAAADLIARSYWHAYGLPVATTRPTNVYGGGDLNRSRLVPEAVSAALAGRPPVIRSDGTPERDFLHVDDAVEAHLGVARALDGEGARGEAFNAGGGRPHAVGDVVGLICAIAGTGVEPDVRGTPSRPGEVDREFVDTSKLRELTGWAPATGLEDGLRRTVQWYRDHPSALAG